MNRLRTIGCNFLWFLTSLPGYVRFRASTHDVQRCQTGKLRKLLHSNRQTEYGRTYGFENISQWSDFVALPLTDYEDYRSPLERILQGKPSVLTRDRVQILQPTSGTSSAPKLIPHTASAAKEFQAALDAWIVDLFLQRPKLFLGSQYWSISPATPPTGSPDSEIPIGFLDDAEYFGTRRRRLMNAILAVPSSVRQIPDINANQYVTLLFLLRARNLRLISVWHPSFLTILLNAMRAAWPRLLQDLQSGGVAPTVNLPATARQLIDRHLKPAPQRADELRNLNPSASTFYHDIWPELQVISCWRNGNVHAEIAELTNLFPNVLIQGKGLLATEGVVSIPLGSSQQQVCAVTSHVIEFQDDNGKALPAWSVKTGESYHVILTTAGGLYRYQLKDRVKVTGFHHKAPCLALLGRTGVVSDCVGEKLHIEQVEDILRKIARQFAQEPRFAMLVPSTNGTVRRYNLLIEPQPGTNLDLPALATSLESQLCNNYHYSHARRLGQLQPVNVTRLAPGAQDRYRSFMINTGSLAGTLKFPALCTAENIEKHLIDAKDNNLALG